MSNFSTVRVGGVWPFDSTILQAELEEIDSRWPKIPNFAEGSTHSPTSVITIGGDGLTVSGPLTASNFVAATFLTGSTLTQNSGSAWVISGDITWQASNWPKVTSRTVKRCGWHLAWTSYTGTPPAGPRAWIENSNSQSGGSCAQTVSETAANRAFGIELHDLPPGATLNNVTVTSQGTSGPGATTTFPSYYVMRWQKSANWSSMNGVSPTADGHTIGNWITTAVDTVITCTTDQVIDPSYHYGVFVYVPYEAGGASAKFTDFVADLTLTKIQLG